MPFLQSSGAISINDIKTLFGGPASPALSNYYRGGSYIPTSKTVLTTSGPFYSRTARPYYWWYVPANGSSIEYAFNFPNDPKMGETRTAYMGSTSAATSTTSFTAGGATYLRGTYVENLGGFNSGPRYQISRQTSSTASINTGIPSSGAISLSQFYGAEKP